MDEAVARVGAPGPERKTGVWHVIWRFYAVVVVVGWNVVGFGNMLRDPFAEPPAAIAVMAPFLVVALFMIFNLGAFRYPYSVFGPFRRTPAPPETPLDSRAGSGGRIGWTHGSAPFLAYSVFPTGLEVSMLGVGSGFVPFGYIDEVRSGFLGRGKVIHHSPEVRSPITLSDAHLVELLQENRAKFGFGPKA